MELKDRIPIKHFGAEQSDILYKTFIFQKLCPGKFLIRDPWPYDELTDEEMEDVKDTLRQLMPLDTMVTDMWDWDIHFEDMTFENSFFDVAIGPEDTALSEAETLQQDILKWIDEYAMDYDQGTSKEGQGEFESFILDQCTKFIIKWRENIAQCFIQRMDGAGPT